MDYLIVVNFYNKQWISDNERESNSISDINTRKTKSIPYRYTKSTNEKPVDTRISIVRCEPTDGGQNYVDAKGWRAKRL